MNLANLLKSARITEGLSLQEVANACPISSFYLGRLEECREWIIPPKLVNELSRALNLDPSVIDAAILESET